MKTLHRLITGLAVVAVPGIAQVRRSGVTAPGVTTIPLPAIVTLTGTIAANGYSGASAWDSTGAASTSRSSTRRCFSCSPSHADSGAGPCGRCRASPHLRCPGICETGRLPAVRFIRQASRSAASRSRAARSAAARCSIRSFTRPTSVFFPQWPRTHSGRRCYCSGCRSRSWVGSRWRGAAGGPTDFSSRLLF